MYHIFKKCVFEAKVFEKLNKGAVVSVELFNFVFYKTFSCFVFRQQENYGKIVEKKNKKFF